MAMSNVDIYEKWKNESSKKLREIAFGEPYGTVVPFFDRKINDDKPFMVLLFDNESYSEKYGMLDNAVAAMHNFIEDDAAKVASVPKSKQDWVDTVVESFSSKGIEISKEDADTMAELLYRDSKVSSKMSPDTKAFCSYLMAKYESEKL